MTVSVQDPISWHTANGATTVFAYQFKILSSEHLEVYVDDVLTTSGFTIDGVGSETGGNVTFTTAPANTSEVLLIRAVPAERTDYDYQSSGDFISGTVNNDIDQHWMFSQQLLSFLENRALLFPKTLDRSGKTNALPAPSNGSVLYWSNGEIQNTLIKDISADVSTVAHVETVETVALIQGTDLAGVTAVQTLGYTAAGDGGAGLYRADVADASSVDDGFLVIVSSDNIRFKLVLNGEINVLQAGVAKDNTESAARQQVVMDYCQQINATPYYPDGQYKIGTTIDLSSPGGGDEGYRNVEIKCGHEAKFEGTSNAITLFNIEGQRRFKWSGGWFRKADVCFQGATGASPQPSDAYAYFNNVIFDPESSGAIQKGYASTAPIGIYWTDCDFGTDQVNDGITLAVDMPGDDVGQSNVVKFTRTTFINCVSAVNMDDSAYARLSTSFVDCRFESLNGYAINAGTNTKGLTLSRCYFEGCGSASVKPIILNNAKCVIDDCIIVTAQNNATAFIESANGSEIETRGHTDFGSTGGRVFVNYLSITTTQYLRGVSITGTGSETYKSLLFSVPTVADEQYIEWELPRFSSTLIDTTYKKKLIGNLSYKGVTSYVSEQINLAAASTDYDVCSVNVPTNSQGLRVEVECYQTVQTVGHTGQYNQWLVYYNSGWTKTAGTSDQTVSGFVFNISSTDANNFKIVMQRTTGGATNSPVKVKATIHQAAYSMEASDIVIS